MKNNNVYYLAQKKNNYNKKNKKKKGILFYLFLLLIVFTVFLISYYYLTTNNFVLVTADYREIVDGFKTEGLLVRDEKVYYADTSGYIEILENEGERVGYGEGILKINDNTIYNHDAALISYATDGLEERLSPDKINNIDLTNYSDFRRKYRQNTDGSYIEKGQALFRTVNNKRLYIVIKTDLDEGKRYRHLEKVFIKPDNPDGRMIDAFVINRVYGEKEALLFIQVDSFVREWLNIRRADFTFIKNIYRGITIPRQAVFTNTAGEGVLVYQPDGSYKFTNITIIDGNDEFVVVNGLDLGQRIIADPEDVDYGRGVTGN